MEKKNLRIILRSFLIILVCFVSTLIIRRNEESPFLLLAFCLFILIMFIISIRKGKRLSFKIGLLFALAHLLYYIRVLYVTGTGYAGLDVFVLYFILDIFLMPLIILLNKFMVSEFVNTIVIGLLGSLCWFLIPIGIARLVAKFIRPQSEASL